MALRLEVTGVTALKDRLRELGLSLDDMGRLWGDIAAVMVSTEEEWFASTGQGSWPPLARTTVREKLRMGAPPDPLIRTGALFESLTDPAQAMQIGQGRSTLGTFTGNAMTWGTSVTDERGREYAHYHQHSHDVTGEPLDYGLRPPERQVIPWPLPITTKEGIQQAANDFVDDAIRRSGLS